MKNPPYRWDSCFLEDVLGSKFAHFCASSSSVRAAFFLNPIRDCVFWHAQKLRILFVIIFMRSPPKMHGQVRWSKFRSRDLTAKNTIVQSVGQKFRPRDLTAKKYHRASVRPGGRPSRYKSWLAFLGGPKIQNSVLILFVRSTSKTHGHADINRKRLFLGSKIFKQQK